MGRGLAGSDFEFIKEYGRALTMREHLRQGPNANKNLFNNSGDYYEYTVDKAENTFYYKEIKQSDFGKVIEDLDKFLNDEKNEKRFDELTRNIYVRRYEPALRADFDLHMNYQKYAQYDVEKNTPNYSDFEKAYNPYTDPDDDWKREQEIIKKNKELISDMLEHPENYPGDQVTPDKLIGLRKELEEWNKLPTEKPNYMKPLKVPTNAPDPVTVYSVKENDLYSKPDKQTKKAVSDMAKAYKNDLHARRDSLEENAEKIQRAEANCPEGKWLKKPNAVKIAINEERAIKTFREQGLMKWEEIAALDSAAPGFSNRYWSALTLDEKRKCGPEKYHEEWKALSWDNKMASDPDYTNEQWDKADYNGKAELNLNKAIKLLKDNYLNLKNKLGHIPALRDFDDYGEMDVLRIFDNSNLGSYYKFLVKYEKEYKIRLSKEEETIVEFISKKLASGKRIQELMMLKRILEYSKGLLKLGLFKKLEEDMKDYGKELSENQKQNIANILTNEFPSGSGRKTYSDCVFIEKDSDDYVPSKSFVQLLSNKEFYDILEELIEFGISRYCRDYSKGYNNSDLVLYQKYTYEDVCRLLNWENNEVPLNIGGYKYDKKTKTFPVFINYDKADDISDTTKYEDHFVNRQQLIAISKSGRSKQSEDVQNFLNSKERGISVELFVRKNKDDSIKEFYYLGSMVPSGKALEFTMANTKKSAVEIEWVLNEPVREDIYDYIVNE